MIEPVLTVVGVNKYFVTRKGFPRSVTTTVRAVDGVSLAVLPGETFGLVDESGCGKSTVARAVLRLIEPDEDSVLFYGEDMLAARGRALTTLRRRLQIVFQDPYSALNPRRTIGQTLAEPLIVHGVARRAAARDQVVALLEEVGLSGAALHRYLYEFSGGQRQRIGISRALALKPELIVVDEPVSALDVSVQAQVLLLLKDLQQRRHLAFVFVSHARGVTRWFCARVAMMYLGRIVEQRPVADVLTALRPHYTRTARNASPIPDLATRGIMPRVTGEIPSAANQPSSCHFHPRCPQATEVCRVSCPPWAEQGSTVTPVTTRSGIPARLRMPPDRGATPASEVAAARPASKA